VEFQINLTHYDKSLLTGAFLFIKETPTLLGDYL
jgi:hypothetical protein